MNDAPKRLALRLEGPYACLVEYVLASDYDVLAAELAKLRDYFDNDENSQAWRDNQARIRELEIERDNALHKAKPMEAALKIASTHLERIHELEAENERLMSLCQRWSESCTGRNGSRAQCVESTTQDREGEHE